MANKKNSGLGRGLDSLIPDISENKESQEGLTLEDILNESDETANETEDEIATDSKDDTANESEGETSTDSKDEIATDEAESDENEEIDYESLSEYEDKKEKHESSNYTDVFNNDDEIVSDEKIATVQDEKIATERVDYKEELSAKTIDRLSELEDSEKVVEIIEEAIINKQLEDEDIPNIEDILKENEADSLLTKEEEKYISEVIETVDKNPRITLWSAKSAAVLRYLRKTQPEFSISKEASKLIDDAIAEKYPEIWTLFNHL